MMPWRERNPLLAITVDDRQDHPRQLMFLKEVTEVHYRGVFGDWRAQGQARKLAHGGDFVSFFHGGIAQEGSVLQQMNM